jgi:predicted transcriptional regulator
MLNTKYKQAAEILKKYRDWRLNKEGEFLDLGQVTSALDFAVEVLEEKNKGGLNEKGSN